MDKGIRRIICSDQQTLVWYKWLPDITPRETTSCLAEVNPLLKISDLVDFNINSWNLHLLKEIVTLAYIPLILSLKPPYRLNCYGYSWHYTNSGNYIIKSWNEVSRMTIDEDRGFFLQKSSFNSRK